MHSVSFTFIYNDLFGETWPDVVLQLEIEEQIPTNPGDWRHRYVGLEGPSTF